MSCPSVMVLVTELVPLANVEPLGGMLTTVEPGQLSPMVGAKAKVCARRKDASGRLPSDM